ncbi:ThuA domain-containing protein [bacterium]|nr:ThuA domain-containing protein [bacterium]
MKSTKPKALILAGDNFHNPNDAFEGIGPVLRDEGIEVECTADFAVIGKEMLADKDLVVILRDGIEFPNGRNAEPVPWMQPEQEEAIEQFVLQGGGFMPLHNAGWGYPWKDGYRRTMGGYYVGHPPTAKFRVEVVNQNHPITAGIESYDITDEQHFLYFDYDRVEVLLVSQGQDGRQSIAGWAYEYGKGRVAYLANGHTLEILQHPTYQKLLQNATRWLLRRI